MQSGPTKMYVYFGLVGDWLAVNVRTRPERIFLVRSGTCPEGQQEGDKHGCYRKEDVELPKERSFLLVDTPFISFSQYHGCGCCSTRDRTLENHRCKCEYLTWTRILVDNSISRTVTLLAVLAP